MGRLLPEGRLVFIAYSRDLEHLSNPETDRLPTWNRDSAWFSKQEASEFVPGNIEVGMEFEFPELFTNRICRFHLVDLVKGQTDEFALDEIEESFIRGKVVSIKGNNAAIQISGSTRGESQFRGDERGVATRIYGNAVFKTDEKVFQSFDMIALGERWGKTRFNDRHRQMESTSLGFSFQLAEPDQAPVVPGIIWAYDAPWIEQD